MRGHAVKKGLAVAWSGPFPLAPPGGVPRRSRKSRSGTLMFTGEPRMRPFSRGSCVVYGGSAKKGPPHSPGLHMTPCVFFERRVKKVFGDHNEMYDVFLVFRNSRPVIRSHITHLISHILGILGSGTPVYTVWPHPASGIPHQGHRYPPRSRMGRKILPVFPYFTVHHSRFSTSHISPLFLC